MKTTCKHNGIATPWIDINKMTGGLQAGNLIIVGGRPGMGKTTFSLNIAEHCAVGLSIPAMYVSLGMDFATVANRILSNVSGIPVTHISGAEEIKQSKFESPGLAVRKTNEAPLYIGTQMETVGLIRNNAEGLNNKNDKMLGVIVVDYLQLMRSSEQQCQAELEADEIIKSLKILAQDLNVAIVLLSQISRRVDERPDKRPISSDLRLSGSTEQHADLIMMIFRDEYYRPETTDKGIAEIIFTEHRSGPIGTVRLAYMPEKMSFFNLEDSCRGPVETN